MREQGYGSMRGVGRRLVWVVVLALFVQLMTVSVSGRAEASVTLAPRVDAGGSIVGGESYVLFGQFDHRLWDNTGKKLGNLEGTRMPILWRVMELRTHDADKTGAILLSHHLLEAMAWQYASEGTNPYYRPGGTASGIYQNTWDGSEVQVWLNSTTTANVRLNDGTNQDTTCDGFLNLNHFSAAEQLAMLDYPYNCYGEGETAPASGLKIVLMSGLHDVSNVFSREAGAWFGSAFTWSRVYAAKAHFKGAVYDVTTDNGYNYWMRSPTSGSTNQAVGISSTSFTSNMGTTNLNVGVRPVFFLNMESIIFKSASDPTAAAAPGSADNPYILYADQDGRDPDSVSVNGSELTIAFDPTDKVVHAYMDTSSDVGLAGRFTVESENVGVGVISAKVDGDNVVLTLARALSTGEQTVTVSYAYATDCSDGLAFADDRKVLSAFAAATQSVTNNTAADFSPPMLDIAGTANGAISTQTITVTAQAGTTLDAVIDTSGVPDGIEVDIDWSAGVASGAITISGTPTAAGNGAFQIGVTNSAGHTTYMDVTYTIAPATNPGNNNPGGGGTGGGSPSGNTTPTEIVVTIGDENIEAEKQPDGSYLIVLPVGTAPTALANLPLDIKLPSGAKISPDPSAGHDFSSGQGVKFTITAANGTTTTITVYVNIESPTTIERPLVNDDGKLSETIEITATYNQNGTLAVTIRLPFVDGLDPAAIEAISAIISRLTNLSFSYVDTDGNTVPITARGVSAPYLQITGTAASKSALESAEISKLTYWFKGDSTQYEQTFDPALKFSDIGIAYTNDPPTTGGDDDDDDDGDDDTGSSGGGCSAGFGLFALMAGAVVLRKRGR